MKPALEGKQTERYFQIGAAILAITALAPAFVFFFLAAKHSMKMLNHFKSGHHDTVASIVPLLVPFMPQLLTAQGYVHRHGFIANIG